MDINKIIPLIRQTRTFLDRSGQCPQITVKGKSNYVTDTDVAIQNFLQKELALLDPSIQFMAEEKPENKIDFTGSVWILDPLDGTTNWIHNFKMSTISLALVENGVPVIGIVYQPFTEELFYAEKGKGAYLNGTKIQVSPASSPADSLIIMGTTPYYKERYATMVMDVTKELFLQCQDIRTLGSAALELAYVACGRAEGFYEKILCPWDFAGGSLLLTEAGGRITQWDGSPLRFDQNCSVLADNGNLGDWMPAVLRRY